MSEAILPAGARISFSDQVDLASSRLGGKVLWANDEFFAPKEDLLKPEPAVFIPGKYTEFGKWMDGWETRRRRTPGHDACVIALGAPGMISGVNIDTSHFIGNFPEYASLEAAQLVEGAGPQAVLSDGVIWKEILPKARLQGGSYNYFAITDAGRWTHLRFKIYPDGGVARLRVHGKVVPNPERLRGEVDLAAVQNGGTVAACNDNFFGPKDNLIMPGRGVTMGDGWETRRKRVPGHDWLVVKLAVPGQIKKVEVDTHHFKGNFPESCSIEVCDVRDRELLAADFYQDGGIAWKELLPRTMLRADAQHFYEGELNAAVGTCTYARLRIYPDGGVSRLRLYGIASG